VGDSGPIDFKQSRFSVLRWGCRFGDGQSYCKCSQCSDHHWQPHRQSSAHATSAFSSCQLLQYSQYWRNVRLQIIFERIHANLVCIINNVINYCGFVVVSLHFNNNRIPMRYRVRMNIIYKTAKWGFSWLNMYKLVIFRYLYFNKSMWYSVYFIG